MGKLKRDEIEMKKVKLSPYVRASRKGSRDAELEDSTGWAAIHKVHKSKKDYERKNFKTSVEENI